MTRRKGKSQYLSAMGKGWEIWMCFVNAVLEKYPDEADELLRKLKDDPQRLERIVAVVGEMAASKLAPMVLPPDHYLVEVANEPVPHKDTLVATGEFGWASDAFDGRQWTHVYPVGGKDVPVGDIGGRTVFLLKNFGEKRSSESVIGWSLEQKSDFAPDGYRPATEFEARAFARVNPGLQMVGPIVALGAFCLCDGLRCVAVLGRNVGGRGFGDYWFGLVWVSACSFLLVRK